jgi:hypothetical protein
MVIYLNGSINSGKTTVAKLLASRLPRTVHIEVDDLRNFAACLSLEEAIPFCLEDALALTRGWVGRGFNVVVSWPISEPDHQRFVQGLGNTGVPIYTFTLGPPLEVALSDRGGRSLSVRERERVAQMYAAGMPEPSFGVVIDNSGQSPEETAEEIIRVASPPGAA